MPLHKHTVGSRTATRALEDFRTDFQGALVLADVNLWAATLGLVVTGDFFGPVTFPLPVSAAGYREFRGEMKYRTLYDRAMSFTTKKFQDGVKALAEKIRMPNFLGWVDEPSRIALEWKRMPNVVIAEMLESGSGADGPVLELYRNPETLAAGTRQLFASDHPYNVIPGMVAGTFDNDRDTTYADIRSGKFFEDADVYYSAIMGPNGKPLGLSMDGGTVLHPNTLNSLFRKALEQDNTIVPVSNAGVPDATASVVAVAQQANMWKGQVSRINARELTVGTVFYTVASGLPNAYPFVVLQGETPEEIIHDESSEMYKASLEVAYNSIGDVNGGAAMPHKLCKWTITG